MRDVQPGDIVFSYVRKQIIAVSVAKTIALNAPRPDGFDETWQKDGWLVELSCQELDAGPRIPNILSELQHLLPDHYSPLTSSGRGNQGYLFRLPPRAGRYLLEKTGLKDQDLEKVITSALGGMEREQVAKARVGQGKFRERLLKDWNGRCPCSGVSIPSLLRASHVKPWRDSDLAERMDSCNGLLLCAHYDAAFDAGLISFRDDGNILFSEEFSYEEAAKCGISNNIKIQGLKAAHHIYLEYHRGEVFLG